MSFLNPWLMIGALGVGGAVLIHLLSRYRHQRMDWGAMKLLQRADQVRTRRLQLENLLLLLLRCLIILLFAGALARPTTRSLSSWGEPDAGVVLALDGSLSMAHSSDGKSRFQRAVEKARRIADTIKPGNPLSVLQMGRQPRVKIRNAGYREQRMKQILSELEPVPEPMHLEAGLEKANTLLKEMTSPGKELYILTDVQKRDWDDLSDRTRHLLTSISNKHRVFLVPVRGSNVENTAVTQLELAAGSLRRGEMVRIDATVRNAGRSGRTGVRVTLSRNGQELDRGVINRLAPGDSGVVSFHVRLGSTGPIRLTASTEGDGLAVDDQRHAVLHVRPPIRVLVADGDPFSGDNKGAADYLSRALAPTGREGTGSVSVQTVPWLNLPSLSIKNYDLIVLANVPDVPEVTAASLRQFVREGGGLIVFAGDNVRSSALNHRLTRDDRLLLPAKLGERKRHEITGDEGARVNVSRPDHPTTRVLKTFPGDAIDNVRVFQHLQVEPFPSSNVLLRLAGGDPLLVERAFGQGSVLLFTSTADRSWNNLGLNPIFPVLLQQSITQMLRRPNERPVTVGERTVLALDERSSAGPVSVRAPDGEVRTYRATRRNGTVVLDVDGFDSPGFWTIGVEEGAGVPVAVNPDPRESDVRRTDGSDLRESLGDANVDIMDSSGALAPAILQNRKGRELWFILLAVALGLLLLESFIAGGWKRRAGGE